MSDAERDVPTISSRTTNRAGSAFADAENAARDGGQSFLNPDSVAFAAGQPFIEPHSAASTTAHPASDLPTVAVPPTLGPRTMMLGALPGFFLSFAATWSCYHVSGVSLGLFFGPILIVVFLAPTLVAGEARRNRRVAECAGMFAGTFLIWLMFGTLSTADLVRCGVVFATFVIFLAGATTFFERVHFDPIYASALTVIIGSGWLTWPVWLCPWLTGPHAQAAIHWLTLAHPLMATNGVLFQRFNFWDRYTLAYQQLTTLNQDVLYTLPTSIWPMAILHGCLGTFGIWLGSERQHQTPSHLKNADGHR